MLGYIISGVVVLVVFVFSVLFFNFRNRGFGALDSSLLMENHSPIPHARQSRRKAARLLKKARKKNRNITSLELTEEYSVFKNRIPMWRSYYASSVSKRRKYKARHW